MAAGIASAPATATCPQATAFATKLWGLCEVDARGITDAGRVAALKHQLALCAELVSVLTLRPAVPESCIAGEAAAFLRLSDVLPLFETVPACPSDTGDIEVQTRRAALVWLVLRVGRTLASGASNALTQTPEHAELLSLRDELSAVLACVGFTIATPPGSGGAPAAPASPAPPPATPSHQRLVAGYHDRVSSLEKFFSVAPVGRAELRSIAAAMGLGHGHWFKCPNGHLYAIGDCGGAQQASTCPDCGETIGGGGYRLAEGNRFAGGALDEGAAPAWPGQQMN